jgi:DNA-binding NarL/FixJ family response regulator
VHTLIIEDDADQRGVVRSLLERAGLGPVEEAVDGPSGIEAATAHQPELILLDIAMPGPSGLEVLPALCERVPRARIVVLSNFPRRLYSDEALRLGAVGYIEKRVPADRLVQEILVAAAIAETALEVLAADLSADPSSARAARTLVRDSLGEMGDELLFAIELLVSELVTNAVLHAASAPRIEAHLGRGTVRVSVFDEDPTLPVHRTPDEDRPGGRGLHLLDRVASRWGAEPRAGGKVVWFELDRTGSGPAAR